ncbi:hypothetical protein V6L77_01410 [Pannonibacter sp. Pt2-lr]
MLAAEAARRFNAPADELRLEASAAHWQGKSLTYAQLLEGLSLDLPLDRSAAVKAPAEYRIVGRKTGRRDLPEKLRGQHPYIHDVDVPGMVHGHVIRPPYAGRDSGSFIGHSLISLTKPPCGHAGLHRPRAGCGFSGRSG